MTELGTLHTLIGLPSIGALAGLALGIVLSIFMFVKVLYFGYRFYIDHGFILVQGSNHKEKVTTTLAKMQIKDTFFAVGYPFAMLGAAIFSGIFALMGHFWYASLPMVGFVLFVVLPAILIRLAAKEKRNKVVFEQKLDGTYDDA